MKICSLTLLWLKNSSNHSPKKTLLPEKIPWIILSNKMKITSSGFNRDYCSKLAEQQQNENCL